VIEPMRVGLMGCGDISRHYAKGAAAFDEFTLVACADLDPERASALAREFAIEARTPRELLGDSEVELVLNLTPPTAHERVIRDALSAGMHVYTEKPLALTYAAARELELLAQANQLALAAAPDTFLGPPTQAARRLIGEGAIGEPIGGFLGALYGPPEAWHPDPEFLYGPGGGPLFDMGPYYLHSMFELLGPVSRLSGMVRDGRPTRRIAAGPRAGTEFPVQSASETSALLELASGVHVTLLASFDHVGHGLPRIEIYGTEGTLSLPDPDAFDGPVLVRDNGGEIRTVTSLVAGVRDRRGAGLADLARACRSGGSSRMSTKLGVHAVEVLEGVLESARLGRVVVMESTIEAVSPGGGLVGRGRVTGA
jgi:predicted dehydrogenase